jgi:hypothetical protein
MALNCRVRPDFDLHYDSISITPYETVFVPVSTGAVDNGWTFAATAAKYEEWADRALRPVDSRPGVDTNEWISDHWAVKADRLVAMNARGPSCFDFIFYVEQNPDLGDLARQPLAMWEHFMLLGQFQGRRHRFSCQMAVGNSFRVAYTLARGARCFDHEYYSDRHKDLTGAGLTTSYQLFEHFAEFGQFERRKARFVCADSVVGLPNGFDSEGDGGSSRATLAHKGSRAGSGSGSQSETALADRISLLEEVDAGEDTTDPVQQALKGAMVAEAAKDLFRQKV